MINRNGQIKIADFGLAKKLQKYSTTLVATLWYRAPELILGVRTYDTKVDIWSVGCIAIELMSGLTLFRSTNNATDLIYAIYDIMGTPGTCDWEKDLLVEGKNYQELKPEKESESKLIERLKRLCPEFATQFDLLDLVDRMLKLNPKSRWSAEECLEHPFLTC